VLFLSGLTPARSKKPSVSASLASETNWTSNGVDNFKRHWFFSVRSWGINPGLVFIKLTGMNDSELKLAIIGGFLFFLAGLLDLLRLMAI
jgi:hypothetical protein